MGGRSRVNDQGLGIGNVGQQGEEPQVVDQLLTGGFTPGQAQGKD